MFWHHYYICCILSASADFRDTTKPLGTPNVPHKIDCLKHAVKCFFSFHLLLITTVQQKLAIWKCFFFNIWLLPNLSLKLCSLSPCNCLTKSFWLVALKSSAPYLFRNMHSQKNKNKKQNPLLLVLSNMEIFISYFHSDFVVSRYCVFLT